MATPMPHTHTVTVRVAVNVRVVERVAVAQQLAGHAPRPSRQATLAGPV